MKKPARPKPTEINGAKLYKVLSPTGESQNGGSLKWDLPKEGQPGKWHEVQAVSMCSKGLHLTTDPVQWRKPNCRVFEVEAEGFETKDDGSVSFSGDKCVARRARLLRELSDAELADVGIIRFGEHAAKGEKRVIVEGSAQVTAYDSAKVTAYDSAQVTATGSAKVTATGSAKVTAYDSAQVTATGSAKVTATGSAKVTAYDSAQVTAYDSADVSLPEQDRWGCPNKATCELKDEAACIDRRSGKVVFLKAEGAA
jgi:hypothetical protein